MSVMLSLLGTALRRVERPRLARMKDAGPMRAGLRRAAAWSPAAPAAFRFWRDLAPRPGLAGGGPPVRFEWCARRADRPAPSPPPPCATLYFHGGAYLAGAPETHRTITWRLSEATGAPVAALAYRLAPENPFPAAFEDARAGYRALIARGLSPERLALAGDSAGGGLALALAAAIDREGGPPPPAVAVFSPFLDLALTGDTLTRFSEREALLPVERFGDAVDAYLAGADPRDPRASPLYATWRAPPPVLFQVGSEEALRSDSERMADALRLAGGDVRLEIWRGAPHLWQFFGAFVPEGRDAIARAGRFIAQEIGAQEIDDQEIDDQEIDDQEIDDQMIRPREVGADETGATERRLSDARGSNSAKSTLRTDHSVFRSNRTGKAP